MLLSTPDCKLLMWVNMMSTDRTIVFVLAAATEIVKFITFVNIHILNMAAMVITLSFTRHGFCINHIHQ